MNKGEYIKILLFRLRQEITEKLLQNVNNYLDLFNLEVKDALIHTVIEDAKREDGLICDKLEEQQYYILLDEKYNAEVKKANNIVLQSLKAKQIKEQKALENSKEYQQRQLKQEFKNTLKAIFKESGRLTKKGLKNVAIIGASSAVGFAKGCKEDNSNNTIK